MKSVYKSEKSTCENFENRVGNESFIFKNIKRRRIINDEKQTIACLYINSKTLIIRETRLSIDREKERFSENI